MSVQQKLSLVLLICFFTISIGCSSNQTMKNVWKGTKSVWYSTVNVPASIDYDETGSLEEYQAKLAKSMVGIDTQLIALEKTMNNADKPPTEQWIRQLFARFPWLSGFCGIKADSTLLVQVPGPPIKSLDFHPLLVEDPKHHRNAVRGYVQDTAMGPEVLLATPLYDAHTFFGVVSVYFDMRSLLRYSEAPDDLVIISTNAILWTGKYNFASTPMSGIAWDQITLEASNGTVSNASGTFYWTLRYIGNVPIIFAVPIKGSFGDTPAQRTGPTREGPFVEAKPLKMPPAPAVQAPPPPQQQRTVRRVVRRPVMVPEVLAPMPKLPKAEPLEMPSPFRPAPAKDEDAKNDGEENVKTEEGAKSETEQPKIAPEAPDSSNDSDTKPEADAPKEEEVKKDSDENPSSSPQILSPFGPK